MKSRIALILVSLAAFSCATAPKPRTVGSVYVDDGGRGGIPVVFIHGNGGSSAQWAAQLAHLRASGRRAIAIDLPGFGRSAGPANGDVSLAAMAAAIDGTVHAIGVHRFVIVGHSYGGPVVATYAAAHPEKVAGVIYVDAAAAALPLTAEQKQQVIAAIARDKMAVVRAWFAPLLKVSSDAVREQVFASVEKTPAAAFTGALMSLIDYDPKAAVNAYHGPRLALVASDVPNPASFDKVFPDVESVAIAGAGHWLMLDKPDEVNAAIDRFLAKVR
jgi:pimeloyl-ACP methyl ester carboxylesterase